MVETIYGSNDKPAYLDPFHTIVEAQFSGGANYVVLQFSVFRRILSQNAEWFLSNNQMDPPPGTLIDPDHILQTLISYEIAGFAWPWKADGGGWYIFPAPPPYDIDPDAAAKGVIGRVTGVPLLPGVSSFGGGIPCSNRAGDFGSSQIQGTITPGGRFLWAPGTGGGPEFRFKNVPVPPSYGGQTSSWRGPTAEYQLYDVPVASTSGGVTLDSFMLSFGSVRVQVDRRTKDGEITGVTDFRAVATAGVPREEGAVRLNPPFTGVPAGQNNNNRADLWVLCERIPGGL
jgi:hypothetical protein